MVLEEEKRPRYVWSKERQVLLEANQSGDEKLGGMNSRGTVGPS
jgi:hypothetical protein